ncbi:MAG: hypothetical protein ACKVHR_13030 [Pirellulales bacterium]
MWDAKTEKEKLTLNGHAGAVWSVAFSPGYRDNGFLPSCALRRSC